MIFARGLDLGESKDKATGKATCEAIAMALKLEHHDIVDLLYLFQHNPAGTRHQLMIELGEHEAMAADIFAMVVFVSDDFLKLKHRENNASGFFKMVLKLPMELQMIVCRRAVGSMKSGISAKDVDVAARYLVSVLEAK